MSEIRISCASLASIMIDNKYLLLLNKRSYREGRIVYTPIGGALEYLPTGKDFLDNLGARYERETPDLRFKMDSENLEIFRFWFEKGIGREKNVVRELTEEMIEEENIFDSLNSDDFEISYIRTETPIKTIKGIINNFFFEIYDVKFSENKVNEIKDYINNQGQFRKAILVTKEEIIDGLTMNKIEIGDNAKSILQ
jgi:hypothetical protein